MTARGDTDFFTWAERNCVSECLMQILSNDGFGSYKDLHELTPAYVEGTIKSQITEGEYIRLKMSVKSIKRHSGLKLSPRDTNTSAKGSSGHEKYESTLTSPASSKPYSPPLLPPKPKPRKRTMPISPTVREPSTTENTGMSDKALEGRLSRATLVSSEKEFLPSDDTSIQLASPSSEPDPSQVWKSAQENTLGKDKTADEEFRFLLLGKSGSGKSATGNTILGETKFTRRASLGSVTDKCEAHGVKKKKKSVEVMDCPGLYDTSKSHEDVATMIVQAVAFTHPGPHAILFVLSALNRYTEEEHKVYERVKALFDEEVTKYIILVFTHGDDLEDEDTTLDDLLKSAPPRMHEVLKECHGRYVLFNNKAKDKEPQVEVLLEEVRNLVRENGGPYQCPKYKPVGEGLEREIQRRVKEMEDRDPKLKAMEDKLREAEMAFQRLIEECEKLEEGKRDVQKMQAAEREVAELKKEKEKAKRRKYEEEMSNMRYKVARQPDDPSTANFLVRGLTSILNRLRGKRK